MHTLILSLLLVTALAAGETRVYFIGNSVTDTVNYEAFAGLGASGGRPVVWGRHMIPGAPLDWLWKDQGGFTRDPFGASKKASSEFAWDAITVQPFDRHIPHDIEVITAIVGLQRQKNPDCRYWIYQRWPRMVTLEGKGMEFDKDDFDPAKGRLTVDLAGIKPWAELYGRTYTGGWDNSNESRDYPAKLLAASRAAMPQAQFRLIPVGDVMAVIDTRLRAGAVPGWDSAWRLYKDGIHLGPTGSYLCGATFAAAILGMDPGTLAPTAYGQVEPALVPMIQAAIAEVLKSTPDAKP